MKRILTFLFATMLTGQAWAQTFIVENLRYTITNTQKHEVSVSMVPENEPIGNLEIPSTVVNGGVTYTVTSIAESAFSWCREIDSVIIPNSVTLIGNNAFYSCYDITSVTIPNSVIQIGYSAFDNCYSLTSVSIPEGVTSIGDWAFAGCDGLTSIFIPNSVTHIGENVFNCSKMTEINVASDNKQYTSIDGILFNKEKTIIIRYPAGKKKSSYSIPNSVTQIEKFAFSGCDGLTSITIPESVTSIGDAAFAGCDGLTSIIIPNSVTYIGGNAFDSCSSLISVIISEGVTSINHSMFINCSALTSIKIPNTVTKIDTWAFNGCSSLASIYISESVITIYDAFDKCDNLKKAEFASIESLCRIDFSQPSSNPLKYAKHLFIDGTEVTKVVIPESITTINEYTFYGCSSLTSVEIPDSVTSIGKCAFYGCSGIVSIDIPESVTSIGENAFHLVKNIVYKGTLDDSPWGALNMNAILDDDFMYADAEKTIITSYIGDKTDIIIPNKVSAINKYAFQNNNNLNSVTIPNSVTKIDWGAFMGCSNLTIYCEVNALPHGWNNNWNYNNRPVIWDYKPTSITETNTSEVNVYSYGNTIVIENATDKISVYDAMGRLVVETPHCDVSTEIHINTAGIYIVKVGSTAKRVIINE